MILICLSAILANAETLTWSADDPFTDSNLIEVDLGGQPRNVTSVAFRALGAGGWQAYWCMVCCDPEGFGGTVSSTLYLLLDVPAGSYVGLADAAVVSHPSPGEMLLEATPAAGHEGWEFLTDGVFTITKSSRHEDYPYPFPYCTASPGGSLPVTVERLELTITCDTVVADANRSWGAIKAIYR
jgi:hypothetical protein